MLLKRFYLLWLTAVFLLQLTYAHSQEPYAVYLTWQQDPTSTMTIQWMTGLNQTQNVIYYKPLQQQTWSKAAGQHERLPQRYPYYVHRVELTQLRPQTEYEFKIGSDPLIYKFRTMPADLSHPLRFIVGGDMYQGSHIGTEGLEATNRLAASTNPDFVLLGGDLAYSGKHFWFASEDGNRWLAWIKAWHQTMITPDGFLIPFLTAIGNHEVNGRFDQTPKQAAFYYTLFPRLGYEVIDFGNYLSVIILDTGHTHPIKGKQTFWLEQVLQKRMDSPYKIALYHVPAYPSHGQLNFKQSAMARKHWVPLFDRYGLNTAFEHHCHTYKRTHPLSNHQIDPRGVLYLGDGAWSVKKARHPKTLQEAPFLAKASAENHFILVDISKSGQRYRAIGQGGRVIDDHAIPSKTNPVSAVLN